MRTSQSIGVGSTVQILKAAALQMLCVVLQILRVYESSLRDEEGLLFFGKRLHRWLGAWLLCGRAAVAVLSLFTEKQ